MNASCQKLLPLYTPEIYDQVIDLPVEKPPLIFTTEKEYLELKNEVGYWQAMQNKTPFGRIKSEIELIEYACSVDLELSDFLYLSYSLQRGHLLKDRISLHT